MDTICVLGKRFSLADTGILRFAETYRLQRKPGQEGNRGRYDTPPPRKTMAAPPEEFEMDPSFQPFEETPREAHGPAPKAPVDPAHEQADYPHRTPEDLFERMMETAEPLHGMGPTPPGYEEDVAAAQEAPPEAPGAAKMPGKLYAPEAAGKGKGERQRIFPGIRGSGLHGKSLPSVRPGSDPSPEEGRHRIGPLPKPDPYPRPPDPRATDTATPQFPEFQEHERALEKMHRELTPQEKSHIDKVVNHYRGKGNIQSIDPMSIALDMDAPTWRIAHYIEDTHGIPLQLRGKRSNEEPTQHGGHHFKEWLDKHARDRREHDAGVTFFPEDEPLEEENRQIREARAGKLSEYAQAGAISPKSAAAGARMSLEEPEVTVQKFLQGWLPQAL